MATDWNALTAEEDRAYFMAGIVEISPESFTIEEKQEILRDMVVASAAIENAMRDDFARFDEVTQTRLTATGGTACSSPAPGTATR